VPHLYLHIPFCKQACHYCDFHFSTAQQIKTELVSAMMLELERRKNELPGNVLQTVYFGGGTPSVLTAQELEFIFGEIKKHFEIAPGAEITLEANPDDLSAEYLDMLRATPVNRLSIGIQSFRDADLKMMNRTHTSEQGKESVLRAKEAGFRNITIDLIYGIPGLSTADWLENLAQFKELGVQHLSAYCLTVESRTALAKMVGEGKIKPVDEEQARLQFKLLVEFAGAAGFEQYEISNFGLEGFIARHNSSYWFGEPYLGIGPSAHSFHENIRRWNISNNPQYVKKINRKENTFEEEILSGKNRYNEFIMTRLRTKWGVVPAEIKFRFGEATEKKFREEIAKWIQSGHVSESGSAFRLTEEGKLLADRVASDLFET
jgi:oxygen-independent coproporphyrinogen III oxidase